MTDIIYPVLATSNENIELRYSLRTLKNLPHRNVFIAGDIPKWSRNVISLPRSNGRADRYIQWTENARLALEDPRCSEDIVLMNDDFFIIQQFESLPVYYKGELKNRPADNSDYHTYESATYEYLKSKKQSVKSFELHDPMPLKKSKLLRLLNNPELATNAYRSHIRSIYGNLYKLKGEYLPDHKMSTAESVFDPSQPFVSSLDITWGHHPAFQYVREVFNERSEYER